VTTPLKSLSDNAASAQTTIRETLTTIAPYEGYVVLGMRIMFGVAYLVVLLSIVGILSKSPDLLWFCFCLGIFWVAIGFIGWGVFLPTGKLIQDVCPMLPMLGENNSNADKLLPIVCPQPPSVRNAFRQIRRIIC
jgi:hypothetical protein